MNNAYSETAEQILQRLSFQPFNFGINLFDEEIPKGVRPGAVFEIVGGHGTGKTELLLRIITKCILPEAVQNHQTSGLETTVIFYDNDQRLDPIRISQLLENQLSEFSLSNELLEQIIEESLKKLIIIRCTNSLELFASLNSVSKLIKNSSKTTFLMIDGLTSFSLLDRLDGELGKKRQKAVLKQIATLVTELNIITFATKLSIWKQNDPTANLYELIDNFNTKDYSNQEWAELVQFRFWLQRIKSTNADSKAEYIVARKIYPAISKPYQCKIDSIGFDVGSH